MSEITVIPSVKIDPIGCYRQAFDLVQGRYWLLLGISAVGTVIAGSAPIVLIGPMMCGIYACFLETQRGGDFEFGLLFEGFEQFVPSLIAGLIMTGIILVTLMPGLFVAFASMLLSTGSAASQSGQSAAPAIATLGIMFALFLVTLVLVVVGSMFFAFAFPLIVDRHLGGVDAVAVSARAVAKNFWGVLGLTLIGTVLSLVGALACYVGSFFILPISFAAVTIAYRKVFPETAAKPPTARDGTGTVGAVA